MNDAVLSTRGLKRSFTQGDVTIEVLRGVDLDVMPGEIVALLGPSGSGKSTMIRCINRLEEHQKGHIIVDGTELTNDLKHIETIRKDVGMVFQHFNLFPHLTVLENCILAPTQVRRMARAQAVDLAMRYLERVRIPDQAGKYPGQLSAGSSSAWPSPVRSACSRASCCSTSRPRRWTPRWSRRCWTP